MDKKQRKLLETFSSYPDAMSDKKRFSSLISDCLPEEPGLRNVLSSAFEAGIADNIVDKGADRLSLSKHQKFLTKNYGFSDENSKWAIDTFLLLVGYRDSEIKELFPKERTDSKEIVRRYRRSKVEKYFDGEICYDESDSGISIREVKISKRHMKDVLKDKNVSNMTLILVIPEKIAKKEVFQILPGAFDQINYQQFKGIEVIVPNTVCSIGADGVPLYGADTLINKGEIPFRLRYSFKKFGETSLFNLGAFQRYLDSEDFLVREDFVSWEIHAYNIEGDFTDIPITLNGEKQHWQKPTDGLWITNGKLIKCTSDTSFVKINRSIKTIGAKAFSMSKNGRILYVPGSVKSIEAEGLENYFDFIIIDGLKTDCWPFPAVKYVYVHENYSYIDSINKDIRRYVKNINRLRDGIYPKINAKTLLSLCEANMDEKDDFELRDLGAWIGPYL